jgi:hypothetical protein
MLRRLMYNLMKNDLNFFGFEGNGKTGLTIQIKIQFLTLDFQSQSSQLNSTPD